MDGSPPPSYLRPSAVSTLTEYVNAEQEYIKAAFSSGSCLPIRGIPDEVKPSSLSQSRKAKAEENRQSAPQVKPGVGRRQDVFKGFEYVPSRYSLADELKRKQRLEAEAKRMHISGRDFVASGGKHKLKHEDTFGNKDFRFPHLCDPYDAQEEQKRRMKWIEDSKILHGPMVPGGRAKPLEIPDRSSMPSVLDGIHRQLNGDWGEYTFEVLSTEDDLVVVRFDLADLDSERGIHAYMNVLVTTSPVCCSHRLVRVAEDWHSKPGDGFLYYMMRPPWVRARTTDAFFTLYPDARAAGK